MHHFRLFVHGNGKMFYIQGRIAHSIRKRSRDIASLISPINVKTVSSLVFTLNWSSDTSCAVFCGMLLMVAVISSYCLQILGKISIWWAFSDKSTYIRPAVGTWNLITLCLGLGFHSFGMWSAYLSGPVLAYAGHYSACQHSGKTWTGALTCVIKQSPYTYH